MCDLSTCGVVVLPDQRAHGKSSIPFRKYEFCATNFTLLCIYAFVYGVVQLPFVQISNTDKRSAYFDNIEYFCRREKPTTFS